MSASPLEGLFIGRTPSESLDAAGQLLEIRAEAAAFCERPDEWERARLGLQEAVVAVRTARERLLRSLSG
ncbi:hypothetical protein [Mycolicibacterium sp.]|uniref:hypothetical protein n=1 Tax=Mycolicibacterium sp. TaxID=2320850 RepID=UPI00355D3F85